MPNLLDAHPDDKDLLLPRLRLPGVEVSARADPWQGDEAETGEAEAVAVRAKRRPSIRRECAICGNPFFVKASHADKGEGKYCSRKCVGEGIRQGITITNSSRKLTKYCVICFKAILVKISRAETEGVYCSRGCMSLGYKERMKGNSNPNFRHGDFSIPEETQKIPKSRTSEYFSWQAMKMRCLNPNHPKYECWGGRGITICQEWIDSFDAFLADMGKKPFKNSSIDRINNDLGYFPENCRWALPVTQSRNRPSAARLIEFNGIKQTLSEWAQEYKIPRERLRDRLNNGWTVRKALTYGRQGR